MNKYRSFYTAEEDAVILKYVKLYPTNLQQAFRLAATELPRRNFASCEHRWYTGGLKNKADLVVSTGSAAGFTHNTKNVPVDKNGDMPDQGLTEELALLRMVLNANPKARAFVLKVCNEGRAPKVKRDTVRVSSTSIKK